MDKTQEIKNIVARFLNRSPQEIDLQTVIDRSALQGSIMIHRMYAELAGAGFKVDDYMDIKNFGQLLQKLGLEKQAGAEQIDTADWPLPQPELQAPSGTPGLSIGIDIEEIANLPEAEDFWEHEFYKQNFSRKEIAYCLLQADPMACFAGKFAAKEAIYKADNGLRLPMNRIEILNTAEGKPYTTAQDIILSISHTKSYAIAVAVKIPEAEAKTPAQIETAPQLAEIVKVKLPFIYKILIVAGFLMAACSLIILFVR